MQKKTMNYVKGAVAGLAVGTAVVMLTNSKGSAGMSLKKNVNRLTKSVSGIADSVKMLVR